MSFFSGFIQGFTGISCAQLQPMQTQPIQAEPIQFRSQQLWTPNSTISLFTPNVPKDKQIKSHKKLREQGYKPYISKTYNNERLIVWQQAPMKPLKKIKKQNYQQPILPPQPKIEPQQPQKLTFWQKIGRGFNSICKAISKPITSLTNWICGNNDKNPAPHWRNTLTSIADTAVQVGSFFLCPPLFWTMTGCSIASSFYENY